MFEGRFSFLFFFFAGIHWGSADLSKYFLLFFQLLFISRVIWAKVTRAKPIPSLHLCICSVDCVAVQFFIPSSSKGCCVCKTAGFFSCSSLSERSRLLQKCSWVQQPADADAAGGAADWGQAPFSHITAAWNALFVLIVLVLTSSASTGRRATNSFWGLYRLKN